MSSRLTLALLAAASVAMGALPAGAQIISPEAYRAMKAALTSDSDAPVASVANVEGLKPGQLKLTGKVLAGIFMGDITRWDAPEIALLNPGVALPHQPIQVVHSSDTSSASATFSSFLAAQSSAFRTEVGSGQALHWSVGAAADNDQAVADAVRGAKNSIGYVDYGFARQAGLSAVRLIDGHSLPTRAITAPAGASREAPAPFAAPTAPKLAVGKVEMRSALPAGLPKNDPE